MNKSKITKYEIPKETIKEVLDFLLKTAVQRIIKEKQQTESLAEV